MSDKEMKHHRPKITYWTTLPDYPVEVQCLCLDCGKDFPASFPRQWLDQIKKSKETGEPLTGQDLKHLGECNAEES
jgi:hypothetical protein